MKELPSTFQLSGPVRSGFRASYSSSLWSWVNAATEARYEKSSVLRIWSGFVNSLSKVPSPLCLHERIFSHESCWWGKFLLTLALDLPSPIVQGLLELRGAPSPHISRIHRGETFISKCDLLTRSQSGSNFPIGLFWCSWISLCAGISILSA